ncbi:MAG: MAPEG family protein [Legionella sp.]|nr:MAPEG family protein [Legionella sp.]
MNLLIFCLLIAVLLPILSKIPLMIAMKNEGGYDNNYPRDQQARLTGFGARALAAHKNSFESLTVFGLAILCAMVSNTISPVVQSLAVLYIIFRLMYHVAYLKDQATLRSLVWGMSYLCSLIILGLCIS